MKLITTKDIIKVTIEGESEIHIKPLTFKQKAEVSSLLLNEDVGAATIKCLKFGIVDLKGFNDLNDQPYTPSRDQDGCISDEVIDLIQNNLSEHSPKIISALMSGDIKKAMTEFDWKPLGNEGK